MTRNPHRVEIMDGPDSRGRYRYLVFWMADYHPGHPDSEYAWRERCQAFHSVPRPEHARLFPSEIF